MLGFGPGGRGQRTTLITILILGLLTSWTGLRVQAEDPHRLKVKPGGDLLLVNIRRYTGL